MAIRRLSTATIKTGSKSNKIWDQDTQQGAMVPIASTDLNGLVTAFGFGSIPQIYKDLVIVATIRNIGGNAGAGWIINNSAGGMTYGVTNAKHDGASAISVRGSSMSYGASYAGVMGSSSTPVFTTMIVNFFDYANTTRKKTWIQRTSGDFNGSGNTSIEVFSNSTTTAITEIACSTANGAIFWDGTATLYGIKAGA
jgi:hypothetical protein